MMGKINSIFLCSCILIQASEQQNFSGSQITSYSLLRTYGTFALIAQKTYSMPNELINEIVQIDNKYKIAHIKSYSNNSTPVKSSHWYQVPSLSILVDDWSDKNLIFKIKDKNTGNMDFIIKSQDLYFHQKNKLSFQSFDITIDSEFRNINVNSIKDNLSLIIPYKKLGLKSLGNFEDFPNQFYKINICQYRSYIAIFGQLNGQVTIFNTSNKKNHIPILQTQKLGNNWSNKSLLGFMINDQHGFLNVILCIKDSNNTYVYQSNKLISQK
jgi:hypothetical protein